MKEMTLEERKAYIQAVADEVAQGKLTLGGAVKRLRENLLGVSQERHSHSYSYAASLPYSRQADLGALVA